MFRIPGHNAWLGLTSAGLWLCMLACSEDVAFNPDNPVRGPSEMLPDAPPMNAKGFYLGDDIVPAPLELAPEAMPAESEQPAPKGHQSKSCDATCRAYCADANLQNPVNRGLCSNLWGAGLEGTPIIAEEACRRLFVDTQGRFPSYGEITDKCLGRPWGELVTDLLNTDEFVQLNRRHWADRFKYDTNSVSVERVYDMDMIVKKLYEGHLSYDQFAAIASAHPVITRKHATPGDRAEALFWTFLGRPPFGDERSDMGRLYNLWANDYYDHPQLAMRLPDAFIRYRCVDDAGKVDPLSAGECTSINFGYEQLILKPDTRAMRDDRGNRMMWSGFLSAEEWQQLQAPGRAISNDWTFWEHAVNVVIKQYLDYDLATLVPEVGEQLVRYVLAFDGDIRAVHFAILTSIPYLQTSTGTKEASRRFTYGPLKQVDAEGWVDSLRAHTGLTAKRCDLRMNRPRDFIEAKSPAAYALVKNSAWEFNDKGNGIQTDYRDLVRTLGGCADNSQGGRFKIVSVLTTANQLNYAAKACDPSLEGKGQRAETSDLLPKGVNGSKAITPELAVEIVDYQTRLFFSRPATEDELREAQQSGTECQLAQCNAEQFARPACFALLSSAEMLFY